MVCGNIRPVLSFGKGRAVFIGVGPRQNGWMLPKVSCLVPGEKRILLLESKSVSGRLATIEKRTYRKQITFCQRQVGSRI